MSARNDEGAAGHHRLVEASDETKFVDKQRWALSLLYLEGRQHLRWNRAVSSFDVDPGESSGASPVTINHLINIFRNVSARFVVNYPNVVCVPATPATDDVVKAWATESAARYYFLRSRLPELNARVVDFLLTCGTSALHTYAAEDNEVRTEAVDPFDLFAEPGSEDWDQSDWITIRRYHTKSALKKAYSDHAERIDELKEVNPADVRMFGKPWSQLNADLSRVETFETYWRDGRHAITVRDLVLWSGRNPLSEIPVRVVRYTAVPKLLWGLSLLYPLTELQALYNRKRAQIMLNVELMGNPKWLVPRNAGVSAAAITNKPGEKIFYNGTAKTPQQVPGAPLPSYVSDDIARLLAEMLDVAGVHSVSLGKRSVGVHSGEAIQQLSARDSSQLQRTQEALAYAYEGVARDAVRLMKIHYPEEKWVRSMDVYGRVVQHNLKRTDLQGDPEVFIEAGTLYRDDVQDRDQQVLDKFKLGLVDAEEARKSLSMHTGARRMREMADLSHAKDILDAVVQGAEVEIFRTDNLGAFAEVFGEFMRTRDYYVLSQERMDYVRDVYLAIVAGGDPSAVAEGQATYKVWPVQPTTAATGALASAIVAPASPMAQAQQAEEVMQRQGERQEASVLKGVLDEEPGQALSATMDKMPRGRSLP